MSQGGKSAAKLVAPSRRRSLRAWVGPAVVLASLACASATFLVIAFSGPIEPNSNTLILLYFADGLAIVLLLAMVLRQSSTLWRAWRKGEAAAGLHMRTVAFFSLVALVPALAVAVVGTVSLERALSPTFMSNLKGFVHKTAEAAQTFRETQCGELLKEAQLTASDLDQSRAIYDADRNLYHKYFESRARTLGFSVAALVHPNGQILDQVVGDPTAASAIVIALPQEDFKDARLGSLQCRMIDDDRTFVGLRVLTSFPDTYLYVTRPMHPFAIEFPRQASIFISNYDAFESFGAAVKRNFAIIYAMLTMILLLSAIWVGLDFANRLVAPIRTLIAATDEVSGGNLAVRVEVERAHGDLSRLGAVFNKMTTELDLQQNRLLEASRINEERRAFTEAVLAGVPAAVIGVDAGGRITVVNRSAEALLRGGDAAAPGRVEDAVPEIAPALADAAEVFPRAVQRQLTIKRGASERIYNIRVTSSGAAAGGTNFVVTLDDITDLVTAQRSSAWADVARRIAHEIKNPLTPIQLSAERLKRKYGKLIETDREIFDQCTDTIVRQVDDIKRMVDEFSTFARMPKARPERDDLCECVRQTAFLMRVGNSDVDIVEELPAEGVYAQIDRRLLSQAVQNVVKNAIEGIAAREGSDQKERGVVRIALKRRDGMAQLDVIDNGKGFPAANRQRLLEPYMTTRAEGTGLGLPIVAKIVEDHGGRLELLDAPSGRGACVRILLPIAPDAEAAAVGSDRTKALSS